MGFIAYEETTVAVDWSTHIKGITDSVLATNVVLINQSGQSPIIFLTTTSFLLNSDATGYILLYQENFIILSSILPYIVRGLGELLVVAIGIRNICLHIAKGMNILLTDALYIFNAIVQLISISLLAAFSSLDCTLDNETVKIINRSTCALIAQGPLLPNQ